MQESQNEKITLENDDAFSEEIIHKKVKLFVDAWYSIPKRVAFRTTKTIIVNKTYFEEQPIFPNLPALDAIARLSNPSPKIPVSKEVSVAQEVPDERFKELDHLLDVYSNTIPSSIRERKKAERKIYSLLMMGQKEGRISGITWQPVEIIQYTNLQGRLMKLEDSLNKIRSEIQRLDERIDSIDRDDFSPDSLQGDVSSG